MSAFKIIQAIDREARDKPGDGPAAYELEITLRSGRVITCSPHKSDSYYLKATQNAGGVDRITYITYDAIDAVVPIWL